MLKKIRLELARDHEHPDGSSRIGYEFGAPLTGEGIGALAEFPLPFGSIGLGISFAGLPVLGGVITGWAPAGSGVAHPSRWDAPSCSASKKGSSR